MPGIFVGNFTACVSKLFVVLLTFCVLQFLVDPSAAQESTDDLSPANREASTKSLPTIDEKAGSFVKMPGYFPLYHDPDAGEIWIEISEWERDFLFSYGLATGLGSNPVGLDRGQLGDQLVCQFRRIGRKALLVATNQDFRALSNNSVERRAVRESFAESVLWGGVVSAESEGSALVNVTSLLISDLHGVAGKLKQTRQGDFSLDTGRSAIYLKRCKSFPDNSEMEATLTFTGKDPGPLVRQVTPSGNSISLRQHVSFVRLPDAKYQPRVHHPRCASIHIRFADYASALGDRLEKRWIIRHRLQKTDPSADRSKAVEPIVYYVDPGAPELIRNALIEGASWWNQAFDAAGFIDAFQVRVLPDDADPMDVRYNVIQWVHRSTRGWSYGGSVVDPRTGEIIKGHVTLGSLRVRQDRLLFEAMGAKGLASCGVAGVSEESTLATLARDADPVEIALARIRQLSAHEVGHTLGFVHNFAASTFDDRASVMDYPAPRIKIGEDQKLDLSDAYAKGIGSWDKWSVQYAYSQFDESQNEVARLNALVNDAIERGMAFVSDADSRPAAASHPAGNLWDNGTEPVAELGHVMKVRRIALDGLRPDLLRPDDALGDFQQLFVPVYLHHRYQVDATAKLIGGVTYSYDTAEKATPIKVIADKDQARAFNALLETIDPAQLLIPERIWQFITPAPYGSLRDVEQFTGATGPIFDRLAAVRVAADLTIGNLLQPGRVSRLAMTSKQNSTWNARKMVNDLVQRIWQNEQADEELRKVSRVVKSSVIDHLLKMMESEQATMEAQAVGRSGIGLVRQILTRELSQGTDSVDAMFAGEMLERIERFQSRPHPEFKPVKPLSPPPGSPIGSR